MLYDRIVNQGTINEPKGKPNPQFALPSAVNWMRALRILAEHNAIHFSTATFFYKKEGKRALESLVENTVFEQLFFGPASSFCAPTVPRWKHRHRLCTGRCAGLVLRYFKCSERDDCGSIRILSGRPRRYSKGLGRPDCEPRPRHGAV